MRPAGWWQGQAGGGVGSPRLFQGGRKLKPAPACGSCFAVLRKHRKPQRSGLLGSARWHVLLLTLVASASSASLGSCRVTRVAITGLCLQCSGCFLFFFQLRCNIHKIYHFKVHILVVFSVFTKLRSRHSDLIPELTFPSS